MNRFEYLAKKASLQARMAFLQAELYNYLISIEVNQRPAERFADFPDLNDYQKSFEPHEVAHVTPWIIEYRQLSHELHSLKY